MRKSAWRHLPAVLFVVGLRDLRADDDYAMGLAEIPISSQEVKERSDHLDTLPENNRGSPAANQKHEESQGSSYREWTPWCSSGVVLGPAKSPTG
jgi:hypothetical protein